MGASARKSLELPVAAAESPFALRLNEIQKSSGVSWAKLATRTGVSVDVLRRVRAGHVPLIDTARRILAAAGPDGAAAARILAWVTSRRQQESIRRGTQGRCRVCGEWEPTCKVRSRDTFRAPREAESASFLHRSCARQPGKVTLVCPEDGCGKLRRVYWSARRKRTHKRRSDGTYAVLCKPHNLSRNGRKQIRRMQEELFRRFEHRLEHSPYKTKRTAEGVWKLAEAGDPRSRRIRHELMGWGLVAKRRRARQGSPRRGPAIARGQLFKRWASKRQGFALCRLCWKLVHGRKYHASEKRGRQSVGPALCWEAWRDSPEFQEERERRRWAKEKPGRQPIEPPVPGFVGHLPQPHKIAQKFGWFARNLDGMPQKQLADEVRVSQPAVATGIENFKRWLPGDWTLVFYRKSTGAILQQAFPLPEGIRASRRRGDEHRVRWLIRWGMSEDAISSLLGYSVGDVRGILARPVVLNRGRLLARVIQVAPGKNWCVETWGALGWELAELSLRAVLTEGKLASRAAIRAFGASGSRAA